MRLYEVMTTNPICCTPFDTVQRAATIMRTEDTGIVPVIENERSHRLVGVVTDRDLCLSVVAEGRDPTSVRVQDCMTSQVVCCAPDDDLEDALERMRENQVRRIPVIDNQSMIQGIVSLADVVRRGEIPKGEMRVTLDKISEATGQPSKPRASQAA